MLRPPPSPTTPPPLSLAMAPPFRGHAPAPLLIRLPAAVPSPFHNRLCLPPWLRLRRLSAQAPSRLSRVASSHSGSSARLSFRWRWAGMRLHASGGGGGRRKESPYKVLGMPPSTAPSKIKRAYRRLALTYHPDVNKEVNAQEKFLRIKHAYNTLMNLESRSKYASSNPDSSWTSGSSKSADAKEQFYGFGDWRGICRVSGEQTED